MFKFLRESKKEFEHVVRPTNKETKKYFSIVTWLIVVLTLFLYVVWTLLSGWLFALKDIINPAKLQPTQNSNTKLPKDLKLWSGSTWTLDLSDIKLDTKAVTKPVTTSTWAAK